MVVKNFNKDYYDVLCLWWKQHNHAIIPLQSLPLGVVVLDEKQMPVCASFLYVMDKCDMCQIAWTTSNPNATLKQRYVAINKAIDSLLFFANTLNKKNIISFTNSTGLEKILKRKGLLQQSSHSLMIGGF